MLPTVVPKLRKHKETGIYGYSAFDFGFCLFMAGVPLVSFEHLRCIAPAAAILEITDDAGVYHPLKIHQRQNHNKKSSNSSELLRSSLELTMNGIVVAIVHSED